MPRRDWNGRKPENPGLVPGASGPGPGWKEGRPLEDA